MIGTCGETRRARGGWKRENANKSLLIPSLWKEYLVTEYPFCAIHEGERR
jgi:hypothetical protein